MAECWVIPPARLRSVVLDCPDPKALAGFYCAVLGGEVTSVEDDWVLLTVDGLRLAFQLVEEFAAPTLGATKHEVQPGQAAGDSFRVYLDPAGHPFCLCWD